ARLGCEVVGTTPSPDEAIAAAELTRRAGLAGQVRLTVASAATLPFRDARFTHVWIVEALPRVPEPATALAEAFRVLRPGGHLAMQEIVVGMTGQVAVPGWHLADEASRAAALRRAGFVELEVRDVSVEAAERSARVQAARAQLLRRLREEANREPALVEVVAQREAPARARASGVLRAVPFTSLRCACLMPLPVLAHVDQVEALARLLPSAHRLRCGLADVLLRFGDQPEKSRRVVHPATAPSPAAGAGASWWPAGRRARRRERRPR